MADVQAGRVAYTHAGGGPATDGFDFTATDGTTATAGGHFAIEVSGKPTDDEGGAYGGGRPTDVVHGGDSDDVIYAPDAGSTIVAGGGHDTIVGGAGLDDVQYEGLRRVHTITEAGGLPKEVAGPEGRDRVSGVEVLNFLDGRVEYHPEGRGHLVERLYKGIFGRGADAEGMSFWAGNLDKNWTVEQVADGIFKCREALGLPPMTHAAYVEGLYQGILERGADPAGLEAFTEALASGAMTRAGVAAAIATSAEAQTVDTVYPTAITGHEMLVAARAYQAILGRAPDADGLKFWDAQIEAQKLTDRQVGQFFAATDEFKAHNAGMTDAQFVDASYRQAFERAGDGPGAAWWLDHLATGTGRQDVAVEFYTAEEGWALRERLAADGLHLLGVG